MEILTSNNCRIKLTVMLIRKDACIYKISTTISYIEHLKKCIFNLNSIRTVYITTYKQNFELQNDETKRLVLSFMTTLTNEVNKNNESLLENQKLLDEYNENLKNIDDEISILQDLI
jgi:hypothetical protein